MYSHSRKKEAVLQITADESSPSSVHDHFVNGWHKYSKSFLFYTSNNLKKNKTKTQTNVLKSYKYHLNTSLSFI